MVYMIIPTTNLVCVLFDPVIPTSSFNLFKCDRIWENPAYRENAQAAQCALLVPQVKICQIRVFVIFISKNLSTNLCHNLRRVNVSYQGEISLHFDLPSLYGSCTRSPLLWALIRILYLDTARFMKLLVRSLTFLASWASVVVNNEIQLLLNLYVHFERLRPGPFN